MKHLPAIALGVLLTVPGAGAEASQHRGTAGAVSHNRLEIAVEDSGNDGWGSGDSIGIVYTYADGLRTTLGIAQIHDSYYFDVSAREPGKRIRGYGTGGLQVSDVPFGLQWVVRRKLESAKKAYNDALGNFLHALSEGERPDLPYLEIEQRLEALHPLAREFYDCPIDEVERLGSRYGRIGEDVVKEVLAAGTSK